MKTANLLSLSALLIVGGLVAAVGCSSPKVGAGTDDSADSTGDDDDSSASATTTTPAASATTTAAATTTDADASTTTTTTTATTTISAACTTCLGTNAQAAAFVTCDLPCTSDSCDDTCFTSSGCTDSTCDNILNTCDSACFPKTAGTPDAQDQACLTCLGAGTPAANYVMCDIQQDCESDHCDNQCFDQACGNDGRSCDQALRNCGSVCLN